MILLKTKKIFNDIGGKLREKLAIWRMLSLETPTLLLVTVFGLALYLQPLPSHTQIHYQGAASKKSPASHASATPKTIQPVAATPQAAPAPVSTAPVPAKSLAAHYGTPKTEPVVTPSPSSNVSGLAPTTPTPAPTGTPVTTGYTSTNWSGYLATGATFTGVSGSWSATNASGNGYSTSADSTWIGIGGVTSSDLIQVGTQNIVAANGQVSTSAFYELLPNVSQPVPGITVSANDNMTASISELGSGLWKISITDNTDGESDTLTVSYASSLSSAEWIEEDPSYSFRRQIPFDNFHEAYFTGGSTIANGSSATIAASTAQPVTMVNYSGQAIAIPSTIFGNGSSFTVTP